MQKKKTLSCLQDNVFLIVFQWPRAALRPDPATASEEAIASLQVSRGWFGGTPE